MGGSLGFTTEEAVIINPWVFIDSFRHCVHRVCAIIAKTNIVTTIIALFSIRCHDA